MTRIDAPASHVPHDGAKPRRRAWMVFGILFALMVVNYADRQIVVSMFPHLHAQWRLSDPELAWLVSIVSLAVGIATVPLSLVADRYGRERAIVAMAVVWSGATFACAFAGSYAELLGARAVVGLGEAAYGAAGAALLATLFPERMRSTILGGFLSAAMVGSVLGIVLGGVLAERWGWRAGFAIAGAPGFLLAALFLFVARDITASPSSGAASARTTAFSGAAVVRELLRPRSALIACLGAGLQLAVVATMYAWLPSYLHRAHGLAADDAAIGAGLLVLSGGVGTLAWSVIADRASVRHPCARLQVPMMIALATAMLLFPAFAWLDPGAFQLVLVVIGTTVMTGTIGPIAAVIVDVVHPAIRGTATAALALVQNIGGLAVGPLVAGVISNAHGLTTAMAAMPLLGVAAAGAFAAASRTYVADVRSANDDSRAPGRLSASQPA